MNLTSKIFLALFLVGLALIIYDTFDTAKNLPMDQCVQEAENAFNDCFEDAKSEVDYNMCLLAYKLNREDCK